MESPILWAARTRSLCQVTSMRIAPRYRLKPIGAAEFELFSEYWQMWRRWEDAFHSGKVKVGTPPVLSEDRLRHDEIEPAVKRALAVPDDSGPVARGEFRPSALRDEAGDGRWGGFEVVWTPE